MEAGADEEPGDIEEIVMAIVWRVLRVLAGLLLFAAIQQGGNQSGKLLGFYAPTSAGTVGFDFATLLWYWLCAWLIYRGIKPARKSKGNSEPKA